MRELAESRNHGDALVHSTRKALAEYGEKLDAGEKQKIEAAISALETELQGNDKSGIDAKAAALSSAAQKLGEKMYPDNQARQASNATPDAGTAKPPEDDVVDAEFKEVKDK